MREVKVMIHSNNRKKALCKWLRDNDTPSYQVSLKLQKFLFFYECASAVVGEEPDFSYLKCYKNGPVFSQVWGDYTKESTRFNYELDDMTDDVVSNYVNSELAESVDFFIRTSTEQELTDITHEMNMWKVKTPHEDDKMMIDDFSESDQNKVKFLLQMYSRDFVRNNTVMPIGDKNFVLSNEDASNLTPEQMDVLYQLSLKSDLTNPVYITVENGVLEVD